MRKIYLLIITLLFSFNLDAQTWEKTKGPYGGEIKDIVVHPNGTVYALGSNPNQGIFRSIDNGNNWVGHNPSVMGDDDSHRLNDLYLASDGTIYALASSNIYKTADDGANWTKVNSGSGSSSGGFDSGYEFAINALSGHFYVMGYHYNDGKSTVFRSTDNGLNWTKGYQGQFFTQFVSNTIGDVYALNSNGTWRSTNDGTTFIQLAGPVPADIISNAYSLTATSDGTQLAISTGASVIYTLSSPSFTTWTAVTETGIEDPLSYGYYSKLMYSADNSTLFLFDDSNNKVYSRTTGDWTWLTSTFITPDGEDITCSASRDATNLYVGSRIGVYKSINGGFGWTEVNTGIENLSMRNLVVADNGDIVVAGLFAYRSTDDGQSWSKIPSPSYNYTVIKATTGSPRTLLLLAAGGGTSYKCVDGTSWDPIPNTPGNANNFASPDGTKILGYSSTQLFYSSDQGTNWSAALTVSGLPASINFNSNNFNSVVMDQNAVIYAYLYDNTPVTGGYKFYKIVPNSTTTPTTATATQIPLTTIGVTSVQDMKFLNNKVYVLGYGSSNNYLSYSADAGVNWTQKIISGAFRMDVDPLNNYIFMTKSNGPSYTIYLSRDEATTFSSSTVALPSNHTYPYGVALDSDGIAYAGFGGSSVYKTTSTIVTPATPTNLVNSGSATDRITLLFDDNATNEQYYVVEKFNGSSYDSVTRTGSFYTTGGKGFVEVRNLQPNTSYQFKVYAQNAAGKSGNATITTSTLEACASDLPDNRSWSGNVNGTTTLTNVSIKLIGNGVYSVSDVNNGTTTATDVIIPGTFAIGCTGATNNTYLYPSYPIIPNGNGTWTSASNTLILKWNTEPWVPTQVAGTVTLVKNENDPAPAAPLNVAAYIYNDNSIEVNWQAVAFEKTFTIERKTGVAGAYAVVGTVQYPEVSFIDPGPLTVNTTYFYQVKSENANIPVAGISPYSNEAQIIFKKPNLVLAQTTVNSTPMNSLGTLWADFNKDGFDDLVLTRFDLFSSNQSVPMVFQNDGAGNFTMAVTNLDAGNYANGTTADYDNDGDLDLFYSNFGDLNRLYNGSGTFTFSKVSPTPVEGAGVGDFEGAPFSASWVDYDKDGLLDLFVGRNGNFNSELYKQNTDHTFTKITTAGDLVNTIIGIFGMAWADYDNDGDQDVFIIDQTSGEPDKLFRNNNDGTFTKITGSVFDADAALRSQSVSWADFDNDQDLDLFVGEENGANSLFRNNGNGTFTKLSAAAFDVTNGGALGSNWVDINNDGFIDLLVTGQTGNSLFINSNGTSITRVAGEKILDNRLYCISASSGDFDNDGFIDIALSRTSLEGEGEGGIPKNTLLFQNNNTSGNWLKVKLTGILSNKSGIGARIKLTTGVQNQIREVNAHIDIASQNSLIQHFGLGSATKADNLVITWPSGTVQTLTNVNANTTITITEDGAGPIITSRTPAVSATSVSAVTTINITLDEDNTAVTGKKLKIAKVSDPATFIHTLEVTDAAKSGNTYTFTLTGKLLTNVAYQVIIDAGAFKDVYGNDFVAIGAGDWTFTTATGPAIVTLSPAHNSTVVSVNTPLEISFDRNISAVPSKKIKVMDGTTMLIDLDVSTSGTVATNKFTLPAPSENWPYNKTLKVTVDEGAFIDASIQTDFAGIVTDSWNFTTVDAPDVTPPTITFTPLASTLEKGFSSIAIAVTVVDNKNVSSATFQHRKIGEKNFQPLTLAFNSGTGKWEGQVLNTFVDDMGFEYFLEASDGPNTGRLPLDNATYFRSTLTFTGTNAPPLSLPSGGTKNSWKVISIPHNLPAPQIETIFSQLGAADKTKWRVIRYTNTPAEAWQEYPTSFTTVERGKGYFINTKDGGTITLANAAAPPNTRDDLFQMTLVSGWNQVGNPYTLSINWEDVQAYNPTAQIGDLLKFNSGNYTNTDPQLPPMQGGFVEAQTAVTISIPFSGQNIPGGGRKGFSTLGLDISADEWAFTVDLRQGELTYSLGSIGMALDAHDSFDVYDCSTPPRFFDYLELNFRHPEHFTKRFTRDIVPTQKNYTWEFTVDSNLEGMGELVWDNAPLLSASKDLFLLDISRQTLVNMKERNSFAFDPKESSRFKIYYGENLNITPEKVSLGNAYPNPTSGYTVVGFSLPESGGLNQKITLDLVDLTGKPVAIISQNLYTPGYHEVSFNAKDLNTGFYTYRLTVKNLRGQATEVNKLIIK